MIAEKQNSEGLLHEATANNLMPFRVIWWIVFYQTRNMTLRAIENVRRVYDLRIEFRYVPLLVSITPCYRRWTLKLFRFPVSCLYRDN